MRIIFVRHGHPNYRLDCLTELGHRQAEAAAKRLADETIDRIYSSTCGRAVETAEHIAKEKGMAITEVFDFIREISWGACEGNTIEFGGHPWMTVDDMVKRGESLLDVNWRDSEPFARNRVKLFVDKVAVGIDELLLREGYAREGEYYRVVRKNTDTVLIASHAGASSAAMSHVLNIPFPQFLKTFNVPLTSVTIITFGGEEGDLIAPRVDLMGDAKHLAGIEETVTAYS